MKALEKLGAPVLDGLLVSLGFLLLPDIRRLFEQHPAWMAWPAALGYLSLCLGVWCLKLIKRSPAQPAEPNPALGCYMGFSALAYAAFVMAMFIYALTGAGQSYHANPVAGLPERSPGLFFALIALMGIWVCLYPATVLFSPQERCSTGSPAALLLRMVGVTAINCMVLVTGAWITAVFDMGSHGAVPAGLRLLFFVLYYMLFLFFYSPPRLLLALVDRDAWGVVSLLVALALFVWPLTG